MTLDEIKLALFDWGHFRNPIYKANLASWDVIREDVAGLDLTHPAVVEAIASYQQFMINTLEPISFAVHKRAPIPDGDIGPATDMLFDIKRCQCPDFAMAGEHYQESTGDGSWPSGCYPDDWPDTHAIKIRFNTRRMKSFLSKVFDSQVWPSVQRAYADVGLMLIREDDNKRAHMQASFVDPDGSWIGLAIVPGHTTCTLSIWQRYDRDYRPRNLVPDWITLLKHEIGHNLNLNHTSGGVMNPGIVGNLPVQWFNVGDPSEPVLQRFFGGQPVNVDNPGPKSWTHQGFKDESTGEELWISLRPPLPRS